MSYWSPRRNLEYYAVVRELLESRGPLGSIADIGSWDTPVATWGDFDQRWTVDYRERPPLSGVKQIVGRWPDCAALLPVCDVVTCLQVLEHLDAPEPFAASLFVAAQHAVILSVPWKWPHRAEPSHKQDPIDDETLYGWTHRQPVVRSIVGVPRRAVLMYQLTAS